VENAIHRKHIRECEVFEGTPECVCHWLMKVVDGKTEHFEWRVDSACKCCTEQHQRCSLPIWPTLSHYYSSGILKMGGT
jgi:hypothetical protein